MEKCRSQGSERRERFKTSVAIDAGVTLRIGIVAVQGAVSEHVHATRRALSEMGLEGEAVQIRKGDEGRDVDAFILPGGESTSISKLLVHGGLYEVIRKRASQGTPVLGTCAGCVLLANEGDEEVAKTGTKLLGLMDMKVVRNAFGRQRESFEAELDIEGFDAPLHAVFIRAPAIVETGGACRPLADVDGKVVMARDGNVLATAFHPELTPDTRIHKMLLKMI